jgi:hypothetical protein
MGPHKAPSNKAFKLTRSISRCRMEALRATTRRSRRPSQLNAMFCGLQDLSYRAQ